ncbi:hypothetical protein [Taibaiella koreensis]|uniref:hypothetical protein n=1 Tax=Taibaiella koreensis TaxID=1268548 RepID=UPI0013C3651B|nr:hypothetical protein [Taibaiella koreensis]
MKRLLSLLMLGCLSYGAMAQAGSLQVRNNSTTCWAHYFVMGGPNCGIAAFGAVLSIPPATTINYPNPAAAGLSTPFIVGAGINNKSAACSGFAVGRVGEPCTGMLLTNPPYASFTNNCAPCGNLTPTWIPAPGVGGPARLIFN